MKAYCSIFILLALIACKKSEIQPEYQPSQETEQIEKEKTVHIDTSYEYEKRTGTSGHYEYTYEVVGTDNLGNEVIGEVVVEGKSGKGIITTSANQEIPVDVEWSGHGILKAVDEEGNEYELQIAK
jgi:hypothetical protein